MASMASFLSFYPMIAAAAINPADFQITKGFGGKITKIQACMSPPGFILHIGPPMGGKYFLNPATSKIKAYGVIQPGVCVLGNALPATINCDKGNPAGIGGFSIGGLLGNAFSGGLVTVNPIYGGDVLEPVTGATQIIGAEIIGPAGAFQIIGDTGIQLASIAGGLGGILPGISIISSLISGDFLGAGLSLAAIFVPVIGPVIAIASFIFSALGINFGKKPPSLGSAYPIIQIGTTAKPVPANECPKGSLFGPVPVISTP